MYSSPCRNWEKAFQLYSPSTNTKYPPVISVIAKLLPVLHNDHVTGVMIWGLTSTEEHYYQNSIEIVSLSRYDTARTKRLITSHRSPAYWPNRLTNFRELGSGQFGKVYKTEDRYNNITYALKQVSTCQARETHRLFDTIISIMTERGSHMRANNSSFIVKMYGAFQDDSLSSYWFLFEYCIGDLNLYMEEIEIDMYIFMDDFLEGNIISDMYQVYQRKTGLDLESIGCIYSFELLAGLSYLAKRNLVHNDLKPDNVLVSTMGHLKIADLGLAQRVKWLDRYSAMEMVYPDELLEIRQLDNNRGFCGNIQYTDPEALIFHNLIVNKKKIYNRIHHKDFPITNGHQDFLTDLYGVALMMMQLLFFGLNLLVPEFISLSVAKRFHINMKDANEIDLFSIRSIYEEDVHKNYLQKIIFNQMTANNQSIFKFMIACFQPKTRRAMGYTKEIEHIQFREVVKSKYINLEKIEDIQYYKRRNITEYTVCSLEFPTKLFNIYSKDPRPIIARDFRGLQKRVFTGRKEMKMPIFQYLK